MQSVLDLTHAWYVFDMVLPYIDCMPTLNVFEYGLGVIKHGYASMLHYLILGLISSVNNVR